MTSTIGVDDLLRETDFCLSLNSTLKSCSKCDYMLSTSQDPPTAERDARRFSLASVLCIVPGGGVRAEEEDVAALVDIDTIDEGAIECQPVQEKERSKSWGLGRKVKQKSVSIGRGVRDEVSSSASHKLKNPVVEVQNDNFLFVPVVPAKTLPGDPQPSAEKTKELQEVQNHNHKDKNLVSPSQQFVGGDNSLTLTKTPKNENLKTNRPETIDVGGDRSIEALGIWALESRLAPPLVAKSSSESRWTFLSPKDVGGVENWAKIEIEGVEVVESAKNEKRRTDMLLATTPDGKQVPCGSSTSGKRACSQEGLSDIKMGTRIDVAEAAEPIAVTGNFVSPKAEDNENEWVATFSPTMFGASFDAISRTSGLYSF